MAEELHDAHSGDVLLEERVYPGDFHAHVAVRVARALAEPVRHPEHRQEDRERDRGERRVEGEEDGHDSREDRDVAEERDEARREELVQGVDVRREARHEPADGRPVEDGDVGALEVGEDPRPEVVHDALAHLRGPRDHDHHEDERERGHEDRKPRDPLDAVPRAEIDAEEAEESVHAERAAGPAPVRSPREQEVDRRRHEQRPRELGDRLEEQDDDGSEHVAPVRAHEGEEPFREARLEGLPEDLLLVVSLGHQAASISSASRWRSAMAA